MSTQGSGVKREEEDKQDQSGYTAEAHFVTCNPDKPLYDRICVCQYLTDLDALFENLECSKPPKE